MPRASPYIVMSISGDKYSIQDLLTHKLIDTHVSNLSEFKYDPSSSMQPIEVAAHNAGEFFVEKIIDHNGLVRNRKDMTFLVRWKGYTNKDDTWESYDNVRQTQAFVDYCTEQKMRSLVSKNLIGSNVL
jgi:hypothetical protein